MSHHPNLIEFAKQLGALLRHYAGDQGASGHGTMELSEAFLEGYAEKGHATAQLTLPLRLTSEEPPKKTPFRHPPDIGARQAVTLIISENYISLRPSCEKAREARQDGSIHGRPDRSGNISLAFDHEDRLVAIARHGNTLTEQINLVLKCE